MRKKQESHLIILIMLFFNSNYYSQNFYNEGVDEYLNGSELKAIVLLTKAIESKQEIVKAYMFRGAAKIYTNDFFGSIQDLQTSLKLDSSDYKTYLYLGRNYFYQGFQQTAIKYYNKAINLNPKDADLYDQRATTKGLLNDVEGGIKDENMAISLVDSVSDYYINRGVMYSALHKYQDAIKDFDKAIQIDSLPQAYSNRGVARAQLGLHKEAISDYTKGIELLPLAIDLPYLRGISYKAIGEIKKACLDISKSADMGYPEAIKEKKNCN